MHHKRLHFYAPCGVCFCRTLFLKCYCLHLVMCNQLHKWRPRQTVRNCNALSVSNAFHWRNKHFSINHHSLDHKSSAQNNLSPDTTTMYAHQRASSSCTHLSCVHWMRAVSIAQGIVTYGWHQRRCPNNGS